MFSLEILIMVSAIVFCIGGLVGAIVSRSLIPADNQKDLEQRLQTSREELEKYQKDVTAHFAETSQLVNNLTQSYKDVHEHIARGAVNLANTEVSKKILQAGDESLGIEAHDAIDSSKFEAPKDWAPKAPGQAGTLSEEFGLNEDFEEEVASTPPGLQDPHKKAS